MNAAHDDQVASLKLDGMRARRAGKLLWVGVLIGLAIAANVQAHFQEGKASEEKKERKPVTYNLMPLIDPGRDAVHGKWVLEDRILRCETQHFGPRVQIRYEPPEE